MKFMACIAVLLIATVEPDAIVGQRWTHPMPKVESPSGGATTFAVFAGDAISNDEYDNLMERLRKKFPETHLLLGRHSAISGSAESLREVLQDTGDADLDYAIVVIDDARRIRAVHGYDEVDDSDVWSVASQWLTGREIYSADCVRCHGEDGALEDYPNIVRLDGIASRMDKEALIEATDASGFVNVRAYTKRDREALATYVLSLYAQPPVGES